MPFDRRVPGPAVRLRGIGRKPAAVAAAVLAAATLPFVRSMWPWDGPVQECVENAGLACVLVAIAGRCWTSLYIGGRKTAVLVTRGPYSMVRNPLYLFSFTGAFGMGACSGSLVVAAAFTAIAVGFFVPIAAREDAVLADRFGADFRRYCAAVPRFLPDPRRWRDESTLVVEPGRVCRTLFDGLPLLLAMPLFELLGELQRLGVLPVLIRLP